MTYAIRGCARRGVSGALCPKSALCGAEFPPKGPTGRSVSRFDRTPRNSRSRTSSDPEGSSDKGRGLCRGAFPIMQAVDRSRQGFRRWVHNPSGSRHKNVYWPNFYCWGLVLNTRRTKKYACVLKQRLRREIEQISYFWRRLPTAATKMSIGPISLLGPRFESSDTDFCILQIMRATVSIDFI